MASDGQSAEHESGLVVRRDKGRLITDEDNRARAFERLSADPVLSKQAGNRLARLIRQGEKLLALA
ncbi:MAG: hypothetical protein JNM76_05480 [Betaproteobacteria bacterium]|nr:hypothetical protein [Betaproteobacteria bacterium]